MLHTYNTYGPNEMRVGITVVTCGLKMCTHIVFRGLKFVKTILLARAGL